MDILTLIVFTIFISLIINLLLKRFHILPIVGYILTGALIAYFLDSTILDKETLAHLAEFGIVFLMFTIGLEFSIPHLKSMKKEVFVYGFLQVALSATFFSLVSYYALNIEIKTSIIIGFALSLSSTAIVLTVLNNNGDIHRPYGRYSLGILLFQDLAVIPILIMISIFANPDASITTLLIDTVISGIVVLFILFILGKYTANKFLEIVVNSKSEELFISAILLIVLSSSLLAHFFGFSYSLGAFFAGMLISETKFKYQIESDLIPFRDLLLGLFFISIGMQLDFEIIKYNIFIILSLTVGILAIKALIIFLIIVVFSFKKRAFKTALALAQVGEFSFAVFALAEQSELISHATLQILIAVVVISLIFTSLVLRYVRVFTDIFFKDVVKAIPITTLNEDISDHIIVCGYSSLGQKVVKQIKRKKISYIAIERKIIHIEDGIKNGDDVIFGNAASHILLHSLNIDKAKAVIIAFDNDSKNRLLIESIKAINKDINIVVKISHDEKIEELKELNIKQFINEDESISKLLVSKAMRKSISEIIS